MKRFVDIMFEEANLFADGMGREGVLDLPVAMNQLTVNIASKCFLGDEIRNEVDAGFAEAYHELQKRDQHARLLSSKISHACASSSRRGTTQGHLKFSPASWKNVAGRMPILMTS